MIEREGIVSPPDVLGIAIKDEKIKDPLNSFSDDPAGYAAFYAIQQERSQQISLMIRDQLQELMGQLESLPFGGSNNILANMRAQLA